MSRKPAINARVAVIGGPAQFHGRVGTVRTYTPVAVVVELDGGQVVCLPSAALELA